MKIDPLAPKVTITGFEIVGNAVRPCLTDKAIYKAYMRGYLSLDEARRLVGFGT